MPGLSDMLDPWSSSLTGRGPPQPRPTPHMGPMAPSASQAFTGALRSWGLPEHTSRQIGAVMPYTPFGGAYQAGQDLGQARAEARPGLGLLGGLQLGMALVPGLRPRVPAWTPPTGPVMASQVEDVLSRMGARDIRSRIAPGTGSQYTRFTDPHATDGLNITVRTPTPALPHASTKRERPGNFFDTSPVASTRARSDFTTNAAGEPLSQWENLLPALRWRLSRDPAGGSWLTRQDQVPRLTREMREYSETDRFRQLLRQALDDSPRTATRPQSWRVRPEPEAPAGNPNQLRLLGAAGAGAFGVPFLGSSEPAEASEATRRRLMPGINATMTLGGP